MLNDSFEAYCSGQRRPTVKAKVRYLAQSFCTVQYNYVYGFVMDPDQTIWLCCGWAHRDPVCSFPVVWLQMSFALIHHSVFE